MNLLSIVKGRTSKNPSQTITLENKVVKFNQLDEVDYSKKVKF